MIMTPFAEEFGLSVPVMQGGMQWIGNADFAAAVSNAGGLGCLTALTYETPRDLADAILRCRDLTSRPFAVNLTTLPAISPPPYAEYRKVMIDSGVDVVETSGSNPAEFMPAFRDAGIKVVHKVTSRRHALKAQEAGVDLISVIGFEAAGHPGELDVPTLMLLPAVVREVDVPVLAAGGFGDGCGLVAALALGAQGVVMATRLMATQEAPIHTRVKRALVAGNELNTSLILRELSNTARVARNHVADEVNRRLQEDGADFESVRELVAGARGRVVYETGDTAAGVWWAGMSQVLIDDVPSCSELVERIAREAETLLTNELAGVVMSRSHRSNQPND